ncbi:transposase [Streptomyces sp. MBT65]|uniref:RNA-guided endonuclease InsQ/TnpB family protein n=1 Tax=Streptomyces sp. MBT65 TaxID=1488395 RepID=UPI001F4524EB|nr:transposase [Streptomyces sp. MBT65]
MSRFRLYPTSGQGLQLLEHCAHARYAWNLAVEQHAHWRPGRRPAPGFAEQCRQLTEARRENDWLRLGSVNVQQQALKDFAKAKSARFGSGFGEPTWRRKHQHEGFRVTDTCDVEKLNRRWARVKVPKIGWVRFRLTTPLPKAKSYRVTYRRGQWHVAFALVPDPLDAPGTGEVIGIDRGVTITAALSDGRALNCPQLTVKERAQIRKHQRRAARAPKGSEKKAAEYAELAKLRAREVNRRKDWCEKTSTMLARTYDVIRFEKLDIKNMTASARGTVDSPGRNVPQKAGLNRAILAQGWGLLRQRTEHKAPGRVEDVPAPYTSLRCSACGWIDKNSRKSQAEFVCSHCGFTCNADTNAATNVAAGHAEGVTPRRQRSSAREPQPVRAGILFVPEGEDVKTTSSGQHGDVVATAGVPALAGLPPYSRLQPPWLAQVLF